MKFKLEGYLIFRNFTMSESDFPLSIEMHNLPHSIPDLPDQIRNTIELHNLPHCIPDLSDQISQISQTSDGSQDKCAICMNSLDIENALHLQCTHQFHSDCINKYLKSNNQNQMINCPLCRKPFLNTFFLDYIPKRSVLSTHDVIEINYPSTRPNQFYQENTLTKFIKFVKDCWPVIIIVLIYGLWYLTQTILVINTFQNDQCKSIGKTIGINLWLFINGISHIVSLLLLLSTLSKNYDVSCIGMTFYGMLYASYFWWNIFGISILYNCYSNHELWINIYSIIVVIIGFVDMLLGWFWMGFTKCGTGFD